MTQQIFAPTDLFNIVKAHVASRFRCVLLPDGTLLDRDGGDRVGTLTGYRYVNGELRIDVESVMPISYIIAEVVV